MGKRKKGLGNLLNQTRRSESLAERFGDFQLVDILIDDLVGMSRNSNDPNWMSCIASNEAIGRGGMYEFKSKCRRIPHDVTLRAANRSA